MCFCHVTGYLWDRKPKGRSWDARSKVVKDWRNKTPFTKRQSRRRSSGGWGGAKSSGKCRDELIRYKRSVYLLALQGSMMGKSMRQDRRHMGSAIIVHRIQPGKAKVGCDPRGVQILYKEDLNGSGDQNLA